MYGYYKYFKSKNVNFHIKTIVKVVDKSSWTLVTFLVLVPPVTIEPKNDCQVECAKNKLETKSASLLESQKTFQDSEAAVAQ